MMDRYAVFGYPIGHSKSPVIHQQFAAQTKQTLSYEAIEVKPDVFSATIDAFFHAGGKGVNCTVPLKELAYDKVDQLTERAEFSGAVNTVKLMDDGTLLGDNTDGVGLLTDLCVNLGLSLGGKRILVLGAGGAARGILGPLLSAKPSDLYLANRTISKAEEMKALFSSVGRITPSSYEYLVGQQFDLIINATSASLSDSLPAITKGLLSPNGVCYDLAYSTQPTAFVRWGLREGASLSVDGRGMLVEQAAHAFKLWRGVLPDTAKVLEGLK